MQQIIATVIRYMNKCFLSAEYINREIWRTCLLFALKILIREENKDMSARYSLLFKVGKYVLADGRLKEAVTYFEDVCARDERHYNKGHLSRLAS